MVRAFFHITKYPLMGIKRKVLSPDITHTKQVTQKVKGLLECNIFFNFVRFCHLNASIALS